MFWRFGSGLYAVGSESQVLRPMITTEPVVRRAKCFKSLLKCQGRVPFLPMPLAASTATMR